MPDLNELFKQAFVPGEPDAPLTILELFFRLFWALILGASIAATYRFTQRRGTPAAPSFIATLVLLCVLLAMVTQVIGNSAARAFSLVGILSIVRFRTTVDDTRDTAFVILAVIIGMAAGVGNWDVAFVGLAVVAVAATVLRFLPVGLVSSHVEWTLHLRVGTGSGAEGPWEAVLIRNCDHVVLTATATARQGAALDLTYVVRLKPGLSPATLLNEINRLEGIQNVEVKRNS